MRTGSEFHQAELRTNNARSWHLTGLRHRHDLQSNMVLGVCLFSLASVGRMREEGRKAQARSA